MKLSENSSIYNYLIFLPSYEDQLGTGRSREGKSPAAKSNKKDLSSSRIRFSTAIGLVEG